MFYFIFSRRWSGTHSHTSELDWPEKNVISNGQISKSNLADRIKQKAAVGLFK